jgi:hypothetical protein
MSAADLAGGTSHAHEEAAAATAMQDAAILAAETIQTAHIRHAPSVHHDVNPSTAAEGRVPVDIDGDEDAASDVEEDEIPVSILRPTPRRPQMPPLPDLRFEQSYLASIKDAKGWQGVAFITLRDQVGDINYFLSNLSHTNTSTSFSCPSSKAWPGASSSPAGAT